MPKQKTTQTERITINDAGCWATVWDIYDSAIANEQKDPDSNDDLKAPTEKSSSSRPISVSSGNKAKTNASHTTATMATVVSESSVSAHPAETQTETQVKGDYHNVSADSYLRKTLKFIIIPERIL